jgi:hypothetical protein
MRRTPSHRYNDSPYSPEENVLQSMVHNYFSPGEKYHGTWWSIEEFLVMRCHQAEKEKGPPQRDDPYCLLGLGPCLRRGTGA